MPHPQPPSLRERIGGRRAVSWPAFAIVGVGIVVGTIGLRFTPLDGGGSPRILLQAVVAQIAAVAVVFLVADRVLLRHRRTRPASPWLVVAIGVALEPARFLGRVALGPGGVDPAALTPHLVSALVVRGITGGALLPALAIVISTIDWYRAERERLIAADVRLELERLQATGAIAAMRKLALETAYGRFATTRLQTAELLDAVDAADAELVRRSSAALLRAARLDVRGASHELWSAPDARAPRISWLAVLGRASHIEPLPARIALPATMMLTFSGVQFVQGVGGAVITMAALAALGCVLYPLGRKVIRALPALALPVTVVVAAATASGALAVLLVAGSYDRSGGRLAGFVIAVVLVSLLTSVVLTALRASEQTIAELGAIVGSAEIETRAIAEVRMTLDRELAAFLHGTLQTRLVAAAYEIESAQQRGDRRALDEALAGARAALDELPDQPAARPASLVTATEEIAERWAGALALSWELPPEDLPAVTVAAVLDVIQESLSNALIHGRATTVAIAVRVMPGAVAVDVADDGIGPQHGSAGLGDAVLTSATGGNWSLERGADGGAVVRALVPC